MSLLLVDKYRPTSLDKLDYHQELSTALKSLATSDDFPHILFYGPSGAGKKTRIMALLRQLFGSGVEKLKVDQRSTKLPNRSDTIETTVVGSAYHIEINPSENGIYDRLVVQDIIKDVAQSQPLEVAKDSRPFKVVVLDEADLLSREAQHGLRRTMEKYMSTCRIIMSAQSLSKVMEAVRSRCLCLRVAAPKHEEIVKVLLSVAKKEGFMLPQPLAENIAAKSSRNLRRAILMLEATKVSNYPLQPNQQVQVADWEMFIQHVGKLIMEQQSPQQLQVIRGKLYELLTHVIPPDVIMQRLVAFLLDKVDNELKFEVSYYAAIYEHRMNLGSKPIFHIEAFIAKFMSLFKAYVVRMFGDS